MQWAQNRFSLIAIIIGALSILLVIVNQNLNHEYVQTRPKLEQVVHEKISGLKKATIDAIKGKAYQPSEVTEETEKRQELQNKIELAKQSSLVLSIFGIVFAAISFIRHENKHSGQVALALNGGVLIASFLFQAAVGLASLVAVLLFIWLIGSFFGAF
ncbi:TPA: hypothetical protein ACKRTE_002670 [Providencia rettgeri]